MRVIFSVSALIFALSAAALNSFAAQPDAVFRGGGVIDLSAADMLLPDSAVSLTVLSLPDSDQGVLFCEGAELAAFDSFDRNELDSLVFVPACEEVYCRIELLPNSTDGSTLTLVVTDSDSGSVSADIEVGYYCWAWAKNEYFSHIKEFDAAAV